MDGRIPDPREKRPQKGSRRGQDHAADTLAVWNPSRDDPARALSPARRSGATTAASDSALPRRIRAELFLAAGRRPALSAPSPHPTLDLRDERTAITTRRALLEAARARRSRPIRAETRSQRFTGTGSRSTGSCGAADAAHSEHAHARGGGRRATACSRHRACPFGHRRSVQAPRVRWRPLGEKWRPPRPSPRNSQGRIRSRLRHAIRMATRDFRGRRGISDSGHAAGITCVAKTSLLAQLESAAGFHMALGTARSRRARHLRFASPFQRALSGER